MVIVNLIADFDLPFVFSLKERRKILNSIKQKLKKFNVSVLDLSGEYPKTASLAIVYASANTQKAYEIKTTIEEYLFRHFPEIEFIFDVEII